MLPRICPVMEYFTNNFGYCIVNLCQVNSHHILILKSEIYQWPNEVLKLFVTVVTELTTDHTLTIFNSKEYVFPTIHTTMPKIIHKLKLTIVNFILNFCNTTPHNFWPCSDVLSTPVFRLIIWRKLHHDIGIMYHNIFIAWQSNSTRPVVLSKRQQILFLDGKKKIHIYIYIYIFLRI